jgi:dTDP-4-dehydrorhamnose reductase
MEKRKPKVFILGASGLLGYSLARHLSRDFLVSGASFHHQVTLPGAQIFPIDPKKPEILDTLVRIYAPDLVVNAVGITDRRAIAAQPKVADNYNILMAVSLALLAAKMKAPFVQLSCASVYDGSAGNYREDNLDFAFHDEHAKQKLAAESYIRAQTMESTTLRIGCVMGIGHPYRASAFDRLRFALSANQPVEAMKKAISNYISTHSFAEAVVEVLKAGAPGRHRLYNVGGPAMSEFDFYEGWAKLLGNAGLVKPAPEDPGRNHSVQTTAFTTAFPQWKPETKEELYLTLLRDLSPGVGVKKWQKILQIP